MKSLFVLIIYFWGFNGVAFEELYSEKHAIKVLKSTLKEKDLVLIKKLDIDDNTEQTEPVDIYKFRKKTGDVYYAIFTRALGRHDYFDYLLVTSSDLKVKELKIIKYRSEHGGEIKSKKWLQQFINYSGGNLQYRKDVTAISGATLSAKAFTNDLPRVMAILEKNAD